MLDALLDKNREWAAQVTQNDPE
ncbi:MAG: hypothetical protein RL676_470, partial [Pseudomonadota bacterium]